MRIDGNQSNIAFKRPKNITNLVKSKLIMIDSSHFWDHLVKQNCKIVTYQEVWLKAIKFTQDVYKGLIMQL